MSEDHKRFTVSATTYMRSASRDGTFYAVHFQRPPTKIDQGTSIGLRFPILVVPKYVNDPEDFAGQVAALLNTHWPGEPVDDQSTASPNGRTQAPGAERRGSAEDGEADASP